MAYDDLSSLQVIFNILRQPMAEEIFPEAKRRGVSIIVRLPLASGLLSGRFDESATFATNDHRNYNRDGAAFFVGETFAGLTLAKGAELSASHPRDGPAKHGDDAVRAALVPRP